MLGRRRCAHAPRCGGTAGRCAEGRRPAPSSARPSAAAGRSPSWSAQGPRPHRRAMSGRCATRRWRAPERAARRADPSVAMFGGGEHPLHRIHGDAVPGGGRERIAREMAADALDGRLVGLQGRRCGASACRRGARAPAPSPSGDRCRRARPRRCRREKAARIAPFEGSRRRSSRERQPSRLGDVAAARCRSSRARPRGSSELRSPRVAAIDLGGAAGPARSRSSRSGSPAA